MRALRFEQWGEMPRMRDVGVRAPGRGEVLLRVSAAGVCHSDLRLVGGEVARAVSFAPPFTLGHETAGEVVETGAGVTTFAPGERVAVYGPIGCGVCGWCAAGAQNHCDRRSEVAAVGVGLGVDGGMADHLTVGANRLVAIGGLDPVAAAVLTDAGLTTYHSVTRVSLGPEPVAVVIGVGGLGHLAVQLLQECTPARVVAVDRRPEAADLARAAGADVAVSSLGDLPEVLRDMGHQADAVFDLVVTSETLGAAASILRPGGELVMVGGGGGVLELGRLGRLPFGARASTPFWGTMGELRQVLDLAARGSLDVHAVTYPLDEAARAFTDLAEGKVLGRAVLIP